MQPTQAKAEAEARGPRTAHACTPRVCIFSLVRMHAGGGAAAATAGPAAGERSRGGAEAGRGGAEEPRLVAEEGAGRCGEIWGDDTCQLKNLDSSLKKVPPLYIYIYI